MTSRGTPPLLNAIIHYEQGHPAIIKHSHKFAIQLCKKGAHYWIVVKLIKIDLQQFISLFPQHILSSKIIFFDFLKQ